MAITLEKTMKIYKTKITVELVVALDKRPDQLDLKGWMMDEIAMNGLGGPNCTIEDTIEIKSILDLPRGWIQDCVPWGSSLSCREILEKNQNSCDGKTVYIDGKEYTLTLKK